MKKIISATLGIFFSFSVSAEAPRPLPIDSLEEMNLTGEKLKLSPEKRKEIEDLLRIMGLSVIPKDQVHTEGGYARITPQGNTLIIYINRECCN